MPITQMQHYMVLSKDLEKTRHFYCDVLGFSRRGDVMRSPDGRIGHAELELGDSVMMIADEWPEVGNLGPNAIGGSPVMQIKLRIPVAAAPSRSD